MSMATIETIIKMLEFLPAQTQARAVEHLREYIEDLRDEERWDAQFEKTSDKLFDAAREARKQIDEGKAAPLNVEKL